ncbi:MAG: UDP-N-acetylmuramate dehydrogenase [Chloroflexi bacterium]|nr:UDP-N-acetylmuramate dehydrogenase [Chloroflexota bacterium]
MNLEQIDDLVIRYNEPLAKYTAARLGGPADILVIAKSHEALILAARTARDHQIPWLVLGGGTNVLISDRGFRGLVIINQVKEASIDEESGDVAADAGVNLSTLARRCMAKGLKGLEWCVSVPGTVGGAVVNNAGAHGSDMASTLSEICVLDLMNPDFLQYWFVDKLKYDYRSSILKGNHGRYLVLEAVMRLEPGHDPEELKAIAEEFVAHRKQTQPPGASLGSIFKNPPGDYAGRLIDVAGLKGHRVGGVQVSPLHGNFFLNDDSGTATQYSQLIDTIQQTVRSKMDVDLEIEIERLGEGFSE